MLGVLKRLLHAFKHICNVECHIQQMSQFVMLVVLKLLLQTDTIHKVTQNLTLVVLKCLYLWNKHVCASNSYIHHFTQLFMLVVPQRYLHAFHSICNLKCHMQQISQFFMLVILKRLLHAGRHVCTSKSHVHQMSQFFMLLDLKWLFLYDNTSVHENVTFTECLNFSYWFYWNVYFSKVITIVHQSGTFNRWLNRWCSLY